MASPTITLPQTPSDVTLELLTRARGMLEHAVSHSTSTSGIDPLIAIHGLDNAIEYLIRITADALDFEGVTGKAFPASELGQMLGELNQFLTTSCGTPLPYLNELKMLRQVRNLVQHGAVHPGSDLPRFITIAQRFFQRSVKQVFGLDPAELRISAIIRDATVRDLLCESEDAIEKKDYLKAIVAARDAFDTAYLRRNANSRLKLAAVPSVARLDATDTETGRFYNALVDQVTASQLGLDAFHHSRFIELVEHIPAEHRADDGSYVVMQRPWSEQDARFSYGFAAGNVLRWQMKELGPLYEHDPIVDHYHSEEFIDGMNVAMLPVGGCLYIRDEGELRLMYVSRQVKDQLASLRIGSQVKWLRRGYKDGSLENETTHQAELSRLHVRLAAHRPEVWEVVVESRQTPFTFYQKEYSGGSLIRESPDINTAKRADLTTLYPISDEMAVRVIETRTKFGPFKRREDLERIPGISDEQINWLANFTHVSPDLATKSARAAAKPRKRPKKTSRRPN